MNAKSFENNVHVWSTSRINLLLSCPRAWTLKYGRHHPKLDRIDHVFESRAKWVSEWHQCLQSVRKVILDGISSLVNGENINVAKLSKNFERELKFLKRKNKKFIHFFPKEYRHLQNKNRSLDQINERFETRIMDLWKLEPFYSMIKKNPYSFQVIDRIKTPTIEDNQVIYNAPDFIWTTNNQDVLVRLIVQGPRNFSSSRRLEFQLMYQWWRQHLMKKNPENKPTILVIYWDRYRWRRMYIDFQEQQYAMAKDLVWHDLTAMNEWRGYFRKHHNLKLIPYAKNDYSCDHCSFQFDCHGRINLAKAKYDQMKMLQSL